MNEFSRGVLTTIRSIPGITEKKKITHSRRSPRRDKNMAPI